MFKFVGFNDANKQFVAIKDEIEETDVTLIPYTNAPPTSVLQLDIITFENPEILVCLKI